MSELGTCGLISNLVWEFSQVNFLYVINIIALFCRAYNFMKLIYVDSVFIYFKNCLTLKSSSLVENFIYELLVIGYPTIVICDAHCICWVARKRDNLES